MRKLFTGLAVMLFLAACQEAAPTSVSPSAALRLDLPAAGARGATFMTRNVYVGAALELVMGATDPNQIPVAVAEVLAQVQVTDFNARAEGIADEIARTRPAVIGLQETVHLYLDGTELYDYLGILQAALAARGLHYTVIEHHTSDITLPMLVLDFSTNPPTPVLDGQGNPQFRLARYVDGDALLVADGVPYDNVAMGDFTTLAMLFGVQPIVRGWIAADVTLDGITYHVVNTHPESENVPVNAAQIDELLTLVAGETRPTVLLGDFNSGPGTDETGYQALLAGSFVDTWVEKNGDKAVWTCCQTPTLMNATSVLDQRIDFVMVRDAMANGNAGIVGGLQTAVVGDLPQDMVLAPAVPALGLPARMLWPSDHAGYVVTLHLPPAVATLGR